MQAMCDSSSPAEGPPLDRRARRGQADRQARDGGRGGGGGAGGGGQTGRGEGGEVTIGIWSQSIFTGKQKVLKKWKKRKKRKGGGGETGEWRQGRGVNSRREP